MRGVVTGGRATGRRPIEKALWEQLGRCAYCRREISVDADTPDQAASWDEIVPRADGGTLERSNRVVACIPCNHRKGRRDVASFCASLRPTPTAAPIVLDVWHGTVADFDTFGRRGERLSDAPIDSYAFSDNAEVARSYAVGFSDHVGKGRLIHARVTLRDPEILDAEGRQWFNVNGGSGENGLLADPDYDPSTTCADTLLDAAGRSPYISDPRGPTPRLTTPAAARLAMLAGYDGLIVRNVIDCGDLHDHRRIAATLVTVFDPAQIEILGVERVETKYLATAG